MLPLLLLLACGPEASDPGPALSFSEAIPTVLTVSWQGSGEGWVEYGLDGTLDRATAPAPAEGGRHAHTLLGLKAGRSYAVRTVTDGVPGPRRTVSVPAAPPSLPTLDVAVSETESEVAEGYVLMTLLSPTSSHVAIADGEGDWVWWIEAPSDRTLAAGRPGLDGQSILYASYDRERWTDDGTVTRVALDGRELSVTATTTAHHMFAERGDGDLAWLGFSFRAVPYEGASYDVFTDTVLIAPEGSQEAQPHVVFDYFDDYGDFYVPCDHALVLADRFGHTDHFEWTHSNSLVHEPESDAYYVSSRHLDALLKIDAATGEVLWQLGGLYETLSVDDPDLLPAHAHLSDAWADGALIFDNGVHREPETSRVVRWRFDEEAGTATPEWVYEPPDGRFLHMLGDARRLPGEHVLVAWSTLGALSEVDEAGRTLWEAQLQPAQIVGRVRFLEGL